jgi:hypothetical protein
MFEMSAQFDRLKHQARRLAALVRPHHLAVAAGLAVLGVGLASFRAVALPEPRPVRDSERLQIEVVAPVEPAITPGAVMEVGELVDGFRYTPPPPAPKPEVYAAWDGDDAPAWEAPEPRRKPRPYEDRAVIQAPPQPAAPEDRRGPGGVSRWLGFDAPARDYRAERDARRARLEARAERERERERDWAGERYGERPAGEGDRRRMRSDGADRRWD